MLGRFSRHKNGLRIKPAVLGMDDGISESAIVQGAVGPDYGPRAHHRNGHGIVPVPAHCGKEVEVMKDGRRGFAAPSSVPPKRRPENGRQASLPTQRQNQNLWE